MVKMDDFDEKQSDIWYALFDQVASLLARHGVEYSYRLDNGDYSINEDNYGWRRVITFAHHLKMLDPEVINGLRALLADLPDWEIIVAVDVLGKEKVWPIMGLTIRKDEIVDGLQRGYFPPEFQSLAYPDSRVGTGYD